MTEGTRELALEAMLTRMKTINPGAGYFTNPKTFSRQLQGVLDLDETAFPGIFVVDGDEVIRPKIVSNARTGLENEFTYLIVGHCLNPKQVSTDVNHLRHDILKAFFTDIHMGGLIRGLSTTEPIRVHSDYLQFVPRATFTVTIPVYFREDL
jgi:hypothetical protein